MERELFPIRERWKDLLQKTHLDLAAHAQLTGKALFLGRRFFQVPDVGAEVAGHLVEGIGQFFDLVAGAHLQTVIQRAAADAFCPFVQDQDGPGDAPGRTDGDKDEQQDQDRQDAEQELVDAVHPVLDIVGQARHFRFRHGNAHAPVGLPVG